MHYIHKRGKKMIIIGLILIVAGVISAIYGSNLNNSISAQLTSLFSTGSTNPGTMFIVLGVIGMVVGLILILVEHKQKNSIAYNTGPRGISSNQRSLAIYEKKCKSCKSIVTDDYKSCPNCGSREFYDSSMDIDLSSTGTVAKTIVENKVICPFCKFKMKLHIPINEFKKMKCERCSKTINSKNVLFED